MDSIFVSYSFDDRGKSLAQLVKDLIRTYNIRSVDGESVGGAPLNHAIRERIAHADALVAVLTPADGATTPSEYVRDEFRHARSLNKRTITLVDHHTDPGTGLWDEFERIELAQSEAAAFLKLSRTLATWRRESGRRIQVAIAPEKLARLVENGNGTVCEARLVQQGRVIQDWKEVPVLPEVGGVAAYLTGVVDEALVQLRVRVDGQLWESRLMPQWIHAELRPKGGAL